MAVPEDTVEESAADDALGSAIDWPKCVEDGCIGVQATGTDRCLAHLKWGDRYELLQGGLTEIDLRGVQVDHTIFNGVRAALPTIGDDMRLAVECRFDHATFLDDIHFRRLQFEGSCTFQHVRADGLFTFDHCRFRPRFAVMFSRCAFAKGVTLANSQIEGRAFVANTSSPVTLIKNSQFEELIVLGLDGERLSIDACSGGRLSVQGCALLFASLKGLNFDALEVGSLSLEESFLLTNSAARTKANLREIVTKEQILIDGCELGGIDDVSGLRAGGALHLRHCTLTARRTLACDGEIIDLSDSRFVEGASISVTTDKLVLDETHYGRSSLIVGSSRDGQGQPQLMSARRADLQNLSLDNVDLSECAFTNAHNLDALRLRRATFATSPHGFGLRPLRGVTKRRVLTEEKLWRARADSRGWPTRATSVENTPETAEVAETYRSLRAGLERARNEPGAADFYYGEMEMRRHDRTAPRAERAILAAYWALSGYGLRASRSVAALALLTILVAVAFWKVGFQDGQPASFWSALTFSIGTATFHPPPRSLTTLGEALSVGFRVLGPLLFGLAVLSIRGRVRR